MNIDEKIGLAAYTVGAISLNSPDHKIQILGGILFVVGFFLWILAGKT